jgi:hypothetical protein
MFEDSRAERSLLNAVVAAMFLAVGIYGIVMPSLTTLFPSAEVARCASQRGLRRAKGRRGRLSRAQSGLHDRHQHAAYRRIGRADFLGQGSCRFALVESRTERAFVQRAEAIGPALQCGRSGSRAIISRKARRSRSPSSARKARIRWPRACLLPNPKLCFAFRDAGVVVAGAARALAVAFATRRGGTAGARHVLWLSAGLGAAIIVLMYAIDAWEIAQMPKRGTPSLWWVRILTDFGKDEYVLAVLAGLLIAVAIVSPALRGIQRSLLLVSERGCSSFSARSPCPIWSPKC